MNALFFSEFERREGLAPATAELVFDTAELMFDALHKIFTLSEEASLQAITEDNAILCHVSQWDPCDQWLGYWNAPCSGLALHVATRLDLRRVV